MEERSDERTFKEICRELLERGSTTAELARHPQLCAEYRYYITLIRRDLVKQGDADYVRVERLAPKRPGLSRLDSAQSRLLGQASR